jgi:hypothetical protein
MQKFFREGLTAQERRVVQKWTWALFVFYGLVLLSGLGLASFFHHGSGSQEIAASQLHLAADRNRANR